MSHNGSTEDNRAGTSLVNTEKEVFEIRTLTQEAINDQIKGLKSPHTSARGVDSAGSQDGDNTVLPQDLLQ